MKLSAPRQVTFWIAVAFAVIGVITKLVPSVSRAGVSGWLVLIGFVILAAGNLVENL
jgi:hypothetical protein